MRFELGLFERDPSTVPFSTLSVAKDVDTPEHRQLARQSAAESLVLLRNTGLLPLDSSRPPACLRRILRLCEDGSYASSAERDDNGTTFPELQPKLRGELTGLCNRAVATVF